MNLEPIRLLESGENTTVTSLKNADIHSSGRIALSIFTLNMGTGGEPNQDDALEHVPSRGQTCSRT